MMKKILSSVTVIAVMMLVLPSCNKDKRDSARLSGETYNITSLTVNGTAMTSMPTLSFDDCDIYDESCIGHWKAGDGSTADFYWQYRDGAETFEIANISSISSAATYEVINYSGIYTVVNGDKDELELSSSASTGYMGKAVTIKMARM